jgi:ubiquinone/menaquinone biosynthesis C-methylase UbiE
MKSGAGVSSTPQRLSKMKRLVWLAPIAVTIVVGCEGLTKLDYTSLGRGGWQRPDDVVAALALRPGDRVADLGAGEGYFIPHLVRAVGPNGRVYAVDVDADRSAALEEEFQGESSVEVILGRLDDPLLPDRALDLILMVNTYHHIEERQQYFSRLRNDLAPGGRVAIIEPDADLSGVLGLLLEPGHASRAGDVMREMHAAGYQLAVSYDHLPVQIFEVFRPREDGSRSSAARLIRESK